MLDNDDTNVRTDGDDYLIETPYGAARLSLSDNNDAANVDLRTSDEWGDLPLDERWHILFEHIENTLSEARSRNEL